MQRGESSNFPAQIEFNRPKKYRVVKQLGSGACGITVHIRDEDMETDFVAKKFQPIIEKNEDPTLHANLLERFREESRILFRLNHPNIVRVYNYYDYRNSGTSYIIMEFVEGKNISEFISENPGSSVKIFTRLLEGFSHLEESEILHRDIRVDNIIIDPAGSPKIIDFGFGKQLSGETLEPEKSIDLNWWCTLPEDFDSDTYDFQTEIYFIGKLFEKIIKDNQIVDFPFKDIVQKMCSFKRSSRYETFSDVIADTVGKEIKRVEFSSKQIVEFRDFANALEAIFSTIDVSSSFNRDPESVHSRLQKLYDDNILNSHLPDPVGLARIFVNGMFSYWKNRDVEVALVSNFLRLFEATPQARRAIILNNLYSRLDSVQKTNKAEDIDDEIPF